MAEVSFFDQSLPMLEDNAYEVLATFGLCSKLKLNNVDEQPLLELDFESIFDESSYDAEPDKIAEVNKPSAAPVLQEPPKIIEAVLDMEMSDDEDDDSSMSEEEEEEEIKKVVQPKKKVVRSKPRTPRTLKKPMIIDHTVDVLTMCATGNVPVPVYFAGENQHEDIEVFVIVKQIYTKADHSFVRLYIPDYNESGVDINAVLLSRYGGSTDIIMRKEGPNVFGFKAARGVKLNVYLASQMRNKERCKKYTAKYTDTLCLRSNTSKGPGSRVPRDGSLCIDMPAHTYVSTAIWRQHMIMKVVMEMKPVRFMFFAYGDLSTPLKSIQSRIISYDRATQRLVLHTGHVAFKYTTQYSEHSDIVGPFGVETTCFESCTIFVNDLMDAKPGDHFNLTFKCIIIVDNKEVPVIAAVCMN